LTGQRHPKTSIVFEFPRSEGDPYYPIPRKQNSELYAQYKMLADTTPGVHFVGRLATYKYYNMDQVVAQSLKTYSKISSARRPEPAVTSSRPRLIEALAYKSDISVGAS
jgi:UDP-galactopyranose mutase